MLETRVSWDCQICLAHLYLGSEYFTHKYCSVAESIVAFCRAFVFFNLSDSTGERLRHEQCGSFEVQVKLKQPEEA